MDGGPMPIRRLYIAFAKLLLHTDSLISLTLAYFSLTLEIPFGHVPAGGVYPPATLHLPPGTSSVDWEGRGERG